MSLCRGNISHKQSLFSQMCVDFFYVCLCVVATFHINIVFPNVHRLLLRVSLCRGNIPCYPKVHRLLSRVPLCRGNITHKQSLLSKMCIDFFCVCFSYRSNIFIVHGVMFSFRLFPIMTLASFLFCFCLLFNLWFSGYFFYLFYDPLPFRDRFVFGSFS